MSFHDEIYSETCIIRPPLGLEKGLSGLYLQVVFISRFILYIIRTICFEIDGLRIQVVFLDSGHIIQVSLYMYFPFPLGPASLLDVLPA